MQWIFYIGALFPSGGMPLVRLGISNDPRASLEALAPSQPFPLKLLGWEEGTLELLEDRKKRFRKCSVRNDWYRPNDAMFQFIYDLPKEDLEKGARKRVSVDMSPEEYNAMMEAVEVLGTITKSRLVRQALTFYIKLSQLKARGYMLQAMKGGRFTAFPDLDDIRMPED